MSRRVKLLLGLAYWWAALSAVGLLGIFHGDCFADQQCYRESRIIAFVGLALAAIGFIPFLRFIAKRAAKRPD